MSYGIILITIAIVLVLSITFKKILTNLGVVPVVGFMLIGVCLSLVLQVWSLDSLAVFVSFLFLLALL